MVSQFWEHFLIFWTIRETVLYETKSSARNLQSLLKLAISEHEQSNHFNLDTVAKQEESDDPNEVIEAIAQSEAIKMSKIADRDWMSDSNKCQELLLWILLSFFTYW